MEWSWRVKLRQAEQHMSQLREEAERYAIRANLGFEHTSSLDGTITVVLRADQEPPMLLGAIIGDVLHNLRSALDAIAWEAVTRAGAPPNNGKDVYFPITIYKGDWPNAVKKKLPGLSAGQAKHFEAVQPWYWDEMARQTGLKVDPELARRRPLARLHHLAKVDRHQTTQPLLARAGHAWLQVPEGITVRAAMADPSPLGPSNRVILWNVSPAERASEVIPDGRALLAFDNESARLERSAEDELSSMVRVTTEALRSIEINLLEVVTPGELANLNALRADAEEIEGELSSLFAGNAVVTSATLARYRDLQERKHAADRRWAERWRELFA